MDFFHSNSKFLTQRKVTSPKSFSPKSFLKLFGQNPDFLAPRSFFIFFWPKSFFSKNSPCQNFHAVGISTQSKFLHPWNFYPVEISQPSKFLPRRNFHPIEISTPSQFTHRWNLYLVEVFNIVKISTQSKFLPHRNFHTVEFSLAIIGGLQLWNTLFGSHKWMAAAQKYDFC